MKGAQWYTSKMLIVNKTAQKSNRLQLGSMYNQRLVRAKVPR